MCLPVVSYRSIKPRKGLRFISSCVVIDVRGAFSTLTILPRGARDCVADLNKKIRGRRGGALVRQGGSESRAKDGPRNVLRQDDGRVTGAGETNFYFFVSKYAVGKTFSSPVDNQTLVDESGA